MTSFDIQEFRTWQSDIVTQGLYKALKEVREDIEREMTDAYTILDPQCQVKMAKLLGVREGLDLVLEMTFEEMQSTESVDDEEEPATSGTQSIDQTETE